MVRTFVWVTSAVLLISGVIVGTRCSQTNAKEAGIQAGDLNGDGQKTLDDVQQALKIALKILPANETVIAAGDLNGDGKITLEDVQSLLRIVLKIDEQAESPKPILPPDVSPSKQPSETQEPVESETVSPEASKEPALPPEASERPTLPPEASKRPTLPPEESRLPLVSEVPEPSIMPEPSVVPPEEKISYELSNIMEESPGEETEVIVWLRSWSERFIQDLSQEKLIRYSEVSCPYLIVRVFPEEIMEYAQDEEVDGIGVYHPDVVLPTSLGGCTVKKIGNR